MNAWHERYRTWQGTVEDVAAEVDGLMPRLGMPPGTSSAPNVRLIRHYLTVGALTRPVRSSRNAFFEGRAVLEVVAIRHLLGQGWPLQKIAELLPTLDWDALVQLLPEPVEPAGVRSDASPRAENPAQALVRKFEASQPGRTTRPAPPPPSSTPRAASTPATSSATHLFAASVHEKQALESDLTALGNPAGAPERREMVHLTVAPWCDVAVDRAALASLTPEQAATAGDALRRLLMQEVRTKGGRT